MIERQNTKLKIQISKKNYRTFLGFVELLVWHLFGIYHLKFGISNYAKLSLIALPILFFGGCYSFTGSSVPSHLKTIYIPFCIDNTGSGEPTLADDFTSKLIDQFISDNSLSVSDKPKSDAMLDCTINSIQDAPTVIQGGETVSMRRLTINARVIYKDYVLKKTVFDKQFSAYADYETDGDVSSLRSEAILSAVDLITEDILLAVVSDW
jgi:hypothetical protein